MEYKNGWKVVKVVGNQMKSCFAPCLATKDYIFDEPTVRTIGNGPLAVFDDYDTAEIFIDRYKDDCDNLMTVRCVYKPSKLKTREYWFTDEYSKNRYRRTIIPVGSCFADEVILKED